MKILLPVDESQACKNTLQWAASFLDSKSAELYLVHAIELALGVPMVDIDFKEAQAILDTARQTLEARGFKVVKANYVVGSATESICQFANDEQVDQIIIGSHSRNTLAKAFMGSISEGVFKRAKQPVLIYRNQGTPSIEMSHLEQVALSER
jgi:nucleotide-binding universal stress UspA family protein